MEKYDAIVVGSGFGGSVAACRLAQGGAQVCIVERGRRYGPSDFPRPPLPTEYPHEQSLARWVWGYDQGLWDVRNLGGMRVVQGAGLGGGSLVYANVAIRAPQSVFEHGWPRDFSRAQLEPYYDLAAHMLDVRPIDAYTPMPTKTKRMQTIARDLGREGQYFHPNLAVNFEGDAPVPVPHPEGEAEPVLGRINRHARPQGKCIGCGECVLGCRYQAKNTLDLNYLAEAERLGATVRTLAEVQGFLPERLTYRDDEREGYRVTYFDHVTLEPRVLWAPHVFVCAGALNSTELLMRSAPNLPALANNEHLGGRFFGNGDGVAAMFETDGVHAAHEGPTITTATLFDRPMEHEATSAVEWFLLQEGGLPPQLLKWLKVFNVKLTPEGDAGQSVVELIEKPLVDAIDAAKLLSRRHGVEAPQNLLPPALQDTLQTTKHVVEQTQRRLKREGRAVVQKSVLEMLEKAIDADLLSSLPGGLRKWVRGKIMDRVRAGIEATDQTQIETQMFDGIVASTYSVLSSLFTLDEAMDNRAIFLVMGREMIGGRLRLDHGSAKSAANRRPRLLLDWRIAPNRPLYTVQERLMRDLADYEQAELRLSPLWEIAKQPITVHPQGGCPMSDDPDKGVVDGYGEVHGHRGLYVLDAAAFPEPIGVNPSASILAIAERAMERHVKTIRTTLLGEPLEWRAPNFDEAAQFARDQADRWHGGAATMEPLDRVQRPDGGSPEPYTPPMSLEFDERMRGYFAPTELIDDLDYEVAERRGRRIGRVASLELSAHAKIADLEVFLDSEGHLVEVSGKVRFAEQTFEVDGSKSTMRLMTFPADPDEVGRRLEYHVEFGTASQRYVLEGTKYVVDDPGFDSYEDLTTLFCKLTCTTDGVTWAGIIRVGLTDFLTLQLPSFVIERGSSDIDLSERTRALARFARFFFGGVFDVYGVSLLRSVGAGLG